MPWIFFALAAPALFSVTNFFDKFIIEKKVRDPLIITILTGFATLILGIGIFIFRGFQLLSFQETVLLLISGILLDFYLIPYFKALTLDDVSKVVPLFQFLPIFVLGLSYMFLHETLTIKQLLGFAFVIVGGFTLATERVDGKIFKPRKSLWLMLTACLLYSLTSIIFKFVVIKQDFWITLEYESIGISLGAFSLLLLPQIRNNFIKESKNFRSSLWIVLSLNEIIAVGAQLCASYAYLLAPVALVSVVGGAQPFFVLTYGLILSLLFPHIIKEDIRKSTIFWKIISICIIFIGIYLINL